MAELAKILNEQNKSVNFCKANKMLFKTKTDNGTNERLFETKLDNSPFSLFTELLDKMSVNEIAEELCLHRGTLKRWLLLRDVPNSYYNDINRLLGYKYKDKNSYREKD
jgi:hypothetical protein